MGLKVFSPFSESMEAYLPELPNDSTFKNKIKSSCVNGETNQRPHNHIIFNKKNKELNLEKAKFLLQKGHNSTILKKMSGMYWPSLDPESNPKT